MLQHSLTNFSFFILILTAPQLRQLVTTPVYVGFVLGSVIMRQVSLPCQYHSIIIPYSYSIHLSMTLYTHRKWQCHLRKCLPRSHPPHPPLFPSALQQHWCHILEACFTPITLQKFLVFLISGFCPTVAVNCALLCYCAVSSCNFLLAFQDNLLVPSSELFGFLNPENGTNSLSRNFGKKPPLLTA
jgi:hypothetical protein